MSLPTLEEEPEILHIDCENTDIIDISETQEKNPIQPDPHIYSQLPDYTKEKAHKFWTFLKSHATTCIHKIENVPKEEYKTILHSVKNLKLEQQKEYSTYSLDNDL